MSNVVNPIKHARRRARILARARRLFAERGFEETGMARVAAACRITKATLYHYFRGKNALLQELVESHFEEVDALTRRTLEADSLNDLLYRTARLHLRSLRRPVNRQFMKIMLSEGIRKSYVRHVFHQRIRERCAQMIREGFGRFVGTAVPESDLRLILRQFFGSLIYYLLSDDLMKDAKDFDVDDETYIRMLTDLFAAGLRARYGLADAP